MSIDVLRRHIELFRLNQRVEKTEVRVEIVRIGADHFVIKTGRVLRLAQFEITAGNIAFGP